MALSWHEWWFSTGLIMFFLLVGIAWVCAPLFVDCWIEMVRWHSIMMEYKTIQQANTWFSGYSISASLDYATSGKITKWQSWAHQHHHHIIKTSLWSIIIQSQSNSPYERQQWESSINFSDLDRFNAIWYKSCEASSSHKELSKSSAMQLCGSSRNVYVLPMEPTSSFTEKISCQNVTLAAHRSLAFLH